MSAIMDDPACPTIYRVSGERPYPDPNKPSLPPSIAPRLVTLRDGQTVATIVPFVSRQEVPLSLLIYLSDQFAKEVDKGDTYAMVHPLPFEKFASYWFQNFGAIMLLGKIEGPEDVVEDRNWSKECLGSFYIKPNYPGRSSHVCSAGFLVTDASRNRGVGRLMGEAYLDYAPKLGYTYSVFNLIYETNVVSCKIWDALGFKRIGRVKGCGNLKSYPGRLIDAIMYGRDLSVDENSEDLVSEERFDKIKFYLKHGKYPTGADRAEKSRLRSAATHYKLLDDGKLMLKDKEVISDPQKQHEIARQVHSQQHGGINKTTATIAEKYHWSRIKETVSAVIAACTECKDSSKSHINTVYGSAVAQGKPSTANRASVACPSVAPTPKQAPIGSVPDVASITHVSLAPTLSNHAAHSAAGRRQMDQGENQLPHFPAYTYTVHHEASVSYPARTLHTPTDSPVSQPTTLPRRQQEHNPKMRHAHTHSHQHHLRSVGRHTADSHLGAPSPPMAVVLSATYQPIDPRIIEQPPLSHHSPSSYPHQHAVDVQHPESYRCHNHNPHTDADTVFQDLLEVGRHNHGIDHEGADDDTDTVDRDLNIILIEQQEDDGSTNMDVDHLELVDTGVDQDDQSKMSVGHVLASPEPEQKEGRTLGNGVGSKDHAGADHFQVEYTRRPG